MAEIRIGTSGWHYKHWLGNFYPQKMPASKMLAWYQQRFDTVELNNSFYRLPKLETFQCWRDATPPDFLFAVKASRFITHNLKLKNPQNALDNFLPKLEGLGEKCGPVLFQLPPSWRVNHERLEHFLSMLPRGYRYTFEFRETSWLAEEVNEILRRHNAAFCIYDIGGFHSPIDVTADWTYIRLHGPGAKYQGSYSDTALRAWADRIAEWDRTLKAIYVYFDNDQVGYAAENALRLKAFVAERLERKAA